ncbi:hypothetical protein ACH5RR_002950 [Cinchona calisaya]|uniref:Uncharacterized protein n=1 Tax=Cinchona calisaya TaxID=153742 RepID=A0ABD3ATK0_9GENT
MAGQMYNFFPTDFLFPRQKTVARDGTHQQVLLVNNLTNNHETEDVAQVKQLKINSNSKGLKASLSSSSLALAPIHKQNQEAPELGEVEGKWRGRRRKRVESGCENMEGGGKGVTKKVVVELERWKGCVGTEKGSGKRLKRIVGRGNGLWVTAA